VPYCSCSHSVSCNMCEADSWLHQGTVQGLRHLQTHPRVLNTKFEGPKLEKFSQTGKIVLARQDL
jgi:hypothetical protein